MQLQNSGVEKCVLKDNRLFTEPLLCAADVGSLSESCGQPKHYMLSLNMPLLEQLSIAVVEGACSYNPAGSRSRPEIIEYRKVEEGVVNW